MIPDPESFSWHLLSDDLKHRLDECKYVSFSRDRQSPPEEIQTVEPHPPKAGDEQDESESDGDFPSLFEVDMPGVMTCNAVQKQVDLDKTKVLFKQGILRAEVGEFKVNTVFGITDIRLRQELWGWRTSRIDDAQEIKGAIAELHAAIGPDLATDLVVFLL